MLKLPGKSNLSLKLRLMPLGGSITYGQGSSNGTGYRGILRQKLIQAGHDIQMVGSRSTCIGDDNAHEGWRGLRIEQIMSKATRSIPLYMPNVIMVNAGSNDCLQDFEMDSASERMDALLEYVWTASPDSTIILSTLLVTADTSMQSRVCRLNAQFQRLAEKKAAESRRIVFVDMQGEHGPGICDLLPDGIHPNDTGYEKIAAIWDNGIQEAMIKNLIEAPQPLPADV